MSQPPDAPDPYLPGPSQQPGQQPGQQPFPQQQPYSEQPYAQQPYPQAGGYAAGGYAPGGRSQEEVRRNKPGTVVRLVQLMWAGAVLALVTGVYALLSLDTALSEVTTEVEQDLVGSGVDPGAFTDALGPIASVTIVVSTLVSVGLWALFAWLLGRGQARVVATVLGGINALVTLVGLFGSADLVELVLQLLTLAVIVGALVLLWLQASSAWFREVKTAYPGAPSS